MGVEDGVMDLYQDRIETRVPVFSNRTSFYNNELITKQEAINLLGTNGSTSIYEIRPQQDPNVYGGVNVISNFVKKPSSDDDVNVGCRQSGATFIITKKGKYLLQFKNYYQFQNGENNYVSQYMVDQTGTEYMVSSKEISGNQNDSNVISSMVFDADINMSMSFLCYVSSIAKLNVYANGHENYGTLSITLLKDDNIIQNSVSYTPAEVLLNRISELETKHATLQSSFSAYRTEQNLLNLEDNVADLSTFSSLQTAVLNLTTALNELKTKFETLTNC